MFIFSRSVLVGVILWTVVAGVNYLKTGKYKDHFAFSVRNYYILSSVFVVGVVIDAILGQSLRRVALFLIFSLAGVVGETLFAVWWHTFYKGKFWTYRVETLAHSYTSLLNFIPWGMGGLLYLNIVSRFAGNFNSIQPTAALMSLPFYVILLMFFLAGLSAQFLIWLVLCRKKSVHFKFETVTWRNFLFFCLPFILSISVVTIVYGAVMLKLALLFAIIASFTEYIFGKVTEFFISKKLWVYNYLAFDNGHFTPLTLIPFALGGFYFWGIALFFYFLN